MKLALAWYDGIVVGAVYAPLVGGFVFGLTLVPDFCSVLHLSLCLIAIIFRSQLLLLAFLSLSSHLSLWLQPLVLGVVSDALFGSIVLQSRPES